MLKHMYTAIDVCQDFGPLCPHWQGTDWKLQVSSLWTNCMCSDKFYKMGRNFWNWIKEKKHSTKITLCTEYLSTSRVWKSPKTLANPKGWLQSVQIILYLYTKIIQCTSKAFYTQCNKLGVKNFDLSISQSF